MILTCPNCSTRYQADAAKFPPTGRNVRCAKCAHVWHQTPPPAEPEPELAIVAAQTPAVAREEQPPVPPRVEPPPGVAARAARVVEPPLGARLTPLPQSQAFAPRAERIDVEGEVEPSHAPPLVARLAAAAGWAGLALVVLVVGWATVSFRGNVVAFWPQSASIYKTLGLAVKARGLELVGITNHVETQDGSSVLIVSGRLVNTSNRELPVPTIRIALTDREQRELYHWPVVSNVPTLRPGESAAFRTRLAHPPGRMHDVEVTFARADE